ncbi:MAG: hypothetical protein ACKO2P_02275 [Planctomycetota bacterium]
MRFVFRGLPASILAPILLLLLAVPAVAQPKIGLRLELLSNRNRQSGPVPLLARLEYNQPQYLEGTLELDIYNAREYITERDLVARIRRDGIVLAGSDYQFNLLLPPLRPSTAQNYAVRAWFVTDDERIPLSSLPDRLNPPEPFDLLMLPDIQRERGRLVASVCENEKIERPSTADRLWLQQLLTFEVWGFFADAGQQPGRPAPSQTPADLETTQIPSWNPLQTVSHFVHPWSSRDLPEDPLWLCAFDLLLMSDRGLASLNPDQLTAVLRWVRAGGSICIHAPESLTGDHLSFLRELLGTDKGRAGDLTLDSEGRLLAVADQPDEPVFAEAELGRAVLLPSSGSISQLLAAPDLQGRLLRFLWRFRGNLKMTDPESFRREAMSARLLGVLPGEAIALDQYGVRVKGELNSRYHVDAYGRYNQIQVTTRTGPNGFAYVDDASLRTLLTLSGLQPRSDGYSGELARFLLPSTLRLVPTWIMFLILLSYITVIGPLEYIVLGWLRARKYTWIVFPATTLFFTLLTMAVAQFYMGGQDSLRTLTITDLGTARQPLRQSSISTIFHGSQATLPITQRMQFATQMPDEIQLDPYQYGYNQQPRAADVPAEYHGSFPQSWTLHQQVRQWSPVSLRTLTLSPETESLRIPDVAWDDVETASTAEGQEKLRGRLRELEAATGDRFYAAVFNGGKVFVLHGMQQHFGEVNNQIGRYGNAPPTEEMRLGMLLQTLPTQRPRPNAGEQSGFFHLFSGLSPDGSGTLEDLVMSDGSDEREWVLLVARRPAKDAYASIDVFRRKYLRAVE